MNTTTDKCGSCPLTETASQVEPAAALASLDRCVDCPQRDSMAPALKLLRTAVAELRTVRAALRRSQIECRELSEGMKDDGQRIAKLEAMQVASGRELEAAVRERDMLLQQVSSELRRVSTPILQVGERVLALPIVGTFDDVEAIPEPGLLSSLAGGSLALGLLGRSGRSRGRGAMRGIA